jgi:hypothetical protein
MPIKKEFIRRDSGGIVLLHIQASAVTVDDIYSDWIRKVMMKEERTFLALATIRRNRASHCKRQESWHLTATDSGLDQNQLSFPGSHRAG